MIIEKQKVEWVTEEKGSTATPAEMSYFVRQSLLVFSTVSYTIIKNSVLSSLL